MMPPVGELFSFLGGIVCGVLLCSVILLIVVNNEIKTIERER